MSFSGKTAVARRAPLGRDFAGLWAATGAANLADGFALFVLPLLAVDLRAPAGAVAGVTVAMTAGWPVFGLTAGLIVDRLDRRRLLLAVNTGRAVILGALALLTATGRLSLPALYVAAFALGVGETLVDTGLTAMVPAAVAPGALGRANARIEATQNVANQFVGPPLAGLIATVGLAWVLTGAAGGYLLALLGLTLMAGRFRPVPARVAERATWRQALDGLGVIWSTATLRTLTAVTAAMNVVWAAWTAVFVLYAVTPGPMALTRPAYGVLLTCMAAGGVAGSLAVEPLRRRSGTKAVLTLDLIGTFLLVAVPAATTSPWLIGPAMVVAGAGSAVWRVIVNSIRQAIVTDDLLGRVYASSRLISWGVLPLGAALGGMIAEWRSVRTVFAVAAAAALALVGVFWRHTRASDLAVLDHDGARPTGQ